MGTGETCSEIIPTLTAPALIGERVLEMHDIITIVFLVVEGMGEGIGGRGRGRGRECTGLLVVLTDLLEGDVLEGFG